MSLVRLKTNLEKDDEFVVIYFDLRPDLTLLVCTRTTLRKYRMSSGHLLSTIKLTSLRDPVVCCQPDHNCLLITFHSGKVYRESEGVLEYKFSIQTPFARSYIVPEDELVICYAQGAIVLRSFFQI
jgi:hypothetical protein